MDDARLTCRYCAAPFRGSEVFCTKCGKPRDRATGTTIPVGSQVGGSAVPSGPANQRMSAAAGGVSAVVSQVRQAPGMASKLLAGGPDWNVVVGPTLPTFPPLESLTGTVARAGSGRLLGNPALVLALTTVLGVGPSLVTGTTSTDSFGLLRLGLGLVAALATQFAQKMGQAGRTLARVLALAFVAAQLWTMGTAGLALVDQTSGVGTAVPQVIAAGATIIAAVRSLRFPSSSRQGGPRVEQPPGQYPAGPNQLSSYPHRGGSR